MEYIDNCVDTAPAESRRRILKIIIYMQKKSSTGKGDLKLPDESVETNFELVLTQLVLSLWQTGLLGSWVYNWSKMLS